MFVALSRICPILKEFLSVFENGKIEDFLWKKKTAHSNGNYLLQFHPASDWW